MYIRKLRNANSSHACTSVDYGLLHTVADPCPQLAVTVTVLSVLLSLVLTLSLSTCAVSAVVLAVMYKRLQRCRAELRGGELCSTLSCPSPSCEAGLLPPSMQGEGKVSKQVQKEKDHQQGRRRRRERRCRLTQPTCPLR